jgi:transcription elongation factor GreA
MQKSYVITKDGLEKLKRELQDLRSVRRPEIADRIAKAKELGDLSENAEYHDAKEALAFLEGRILEIEDFIAHAKVTEAVSTEAVNVGCRVRCRVNGKEKEYLIVGSNESDPAHGRISNESPLGKSLLGRKKGDAFESTVPSGTMRYEIIDIVC